MPAPEKIAALLSSGIDSVALLNHYCRGPYHVTPLYIQSGFRWEESELYWLKKFLRAVRFKNIDTLAALFFPMKDSYGTHWSITGVKVPSARAKASETFLPGRNMILLSKGALYCALNGIKTLAIGTNKTYTFEDGKNTFFKDAQGLFARSCGVELKIAAPFIEKGKEELMYDARELGFDHSFSCFNPRGHLHCGECYKCAERKKVFARAGITDKTVYYKKSSQHSARS